MIAETPAWLLWTMVGLMVFIMLLPLLKALSDQPLPGADGGHTRFRGSRILSKPPVPASRVPLFLRRMAAARARRDWAQPQGRNPGTTQ
jgi:hypothetical protein